MGEVEICMDEDGALKVVQRYDLRPVLRRLRPKGFERHRVFKRPSCSFKWPDSSCWSRDVQEAKFIRVLKVVFIFTLCLGTINLIFYEHIVSHGPMAWNYIIARTWLYGHFEIGRAGILFLAKFAIILTAGVLARNVTKDAGPAPPSREEVQTVSALVQQV